MGNYTLHYVINYKEKVFEKEYTRACVYMCICIYICYTCSVIHTHIFMCNGMAVLYT